MKMLYDFKSEHISVLNREKAIEKANDDIATAINSAYSRATRDGFTINAVASAHAHLDRYDFNAFMDLWKDNDFCPIVYAQNYTNEYLDGKCFIIAFARGLNDLDAIDAYDFATEF